jgi:hypothetical protein
MKENVKQLLTLIGVDSVTIQALQSDEAPEGFSLEDAAKAYTLKRRELVLNDGDTQKELKRKYNSEMYPAMMKPVLKELQRLTGLSSDQLKAITKEGDSLPNMKEAISLGIENYSKTAATGVDEVKQQLFELKSKYETATTSWTQEKENLITGFKTERKMEKVKRHFENSVNGLDLILPSEAANVMLSTVLMNRYKFDVSDDGKLEVFTKEGGKVDDGNNFLSATDIIKQQADDFKILKKSNGGGGEESTTSKKTTIKPVEGDSDAVRRMKEKIAAENR